MSRTMKPDTSKKHPQAGNHVMVQRGPLKGTAVKVVDFLTNQFQGKSIKSLKERADLSPEIHVLKARGFEVTEKTVFVCVPETPPRYILMDDSELVTEAQKPKLTSIDGGKDDTGTTSEGDSGTTESNGSESDGRSISGSEDDSADAGEAEDSGQADSEVGSGPGSDEDSTPRSDKPKAGSGKPAKDGKPVAKSGGTKRGN